MKHPFLCLISLLLISCTSPSASVDLEKQAIVENVVEEQSQGESDQKLQEFVNEENSEESEPGICKGELVGAEYDVIVARAGVEVELIWRPEFMPFDVSVGPDNRIFGVPQGGEEVFELKSDGSAEVTFQCPGVQMATVAAATDGAIWFTTRGDCSLVRVDPSGEFTLIYQNGNCNIEPGPDGTVYAMDNGIVKVYPDGNQEQVTDQVQDERSFAVSSNGDVVVGTYDGRIVKVDDSGELTELITGLCLEPEVFFNSESELYVNDCGIIKQVDLQTGKASTLSWIDNNPSSFSIFVDNTHILHYHSSLYDMRISDLDKRTTDIFYDIKGYSLAFALNPQDVIYIAFGNNQPEGKTDVYKLAGKNLEYILSIPYGFERAMTFDQNGIGYIALGDRIKGGAIYKFDPASLNLEEYQQTTCVPSVIGVHPKTNQVWWDDCGNFFSKAEDGSQQTFAGVDHIALYSGLVITDKEEFYTVGFHPVPDRQTPNPRFLYKYDGNILEWSQIVDLSQRTAVVPLATVTSCPNGDLYIIEGVDQTTLPVMRHSMNAALKLQEDGSLKLLAFDISHDTGTAACDSDNNLVFPTGGGIFKITMAW